MSIYPDKNRRGQLTGRFRIEVQRGGTTLRERSDSLREAKLIEQQLIARFERGEVEKVKRDKPGPRMVSEVVTLAEAAKRAQGTLWRGQATELESFRKLARIVSIVGPHTALDLFDMNTVDDIVKELEEDEATDATINRYLSCLSAFMRFARKRGLRTVPPPEIEWRKEAENRIRWLTYKEEKELLFLLPEPFSSITYAAIRTGMRASELLSLTPAQIEPEWVRLWKTKGGTTRNIPITADLHELLVRLVSEGLPDYWKLRSAWDKAKAAMGLKDDRTFVFHACRHTFATRAVQANVHIRVIQKLMGHKSIETTLRYAHLDDRTAHDEAVKAIRFHDEQGKGAGGTILSRRQSAPRGATSNRRSQPFVPPECLPTETANPFTPVRFRLGPPRFSASFANDD